MKNIDDLFELVIFEDNDIEEYKIIFSDSEYDDILDMVFTEDGLVSEKYKIKITVYGDEGNTPHFHFFRNKDLSNAGNNYSNNGGCICILRARYFSHGTKVIELNSREMKRLKKFLQERWKRSNVDNSSNIKLDLFKGETNWDFVKYLWNTGNPKNKVPEDLEMPDYKSDMKNHNERMGINEFEI